MKASEQLDQDWQGFLQGLIDEIGDLSRLAYDKEIIAKKLRRHYTDEQIQMGFLEYDKKFGKPLVQGGSALKGERYVNRLNWYNPTQAGPLWGKLQTLLKSRGWTEEHIQDLDLQSSRVASHLAAPKGDPTMVKGLVLGYVQSGKTANFSATIAKATDEGYRLVIVLSGIHNNLRSQTERRLRSELTDPDGGTRSFTLTNSDPNGDFNAEPTFTPNAVLNNRDRFTLAVLKKNPSVLKKFAAWLKQARKDVLASCPVLIIDDEADQASVNDARERDRQSAVNRCIRDLLDLFTECQCVVSYVGYTATPFANILMDAAEASDLFPRDFIIALKAADTYIGAEKVFGRAAVDGDNGEAGLNLVRYLGPQDVIRTDQSGLASGLTPAMKRAVLSFLLAAAERLRRGQKNKHITMLFNTSHLKAQHAEACEQVEGYLQRITNLVRMKESKTLETLQALWEKDFIQTTREDFASQEIGEFNEILSSLEEFLEGLQVIKENSESESRLNFEEGRVWAVIIGGNTLSRGLTIEGLTVSYFHRTTNGYDTLLQMGRWFGYRSGYIDLTRIFVTRNMASNFYHLATVEQELRDDIARMEMGAFRPIDIALRIRDHDRLQVTHKKVLRRNARFASNSYAGSKIQATHLFLDDLKKAQTNLAQIQTLLTQLEFRSLRHLSPWPEFKRSLLYKNVPASLILDFLADYQFSPADKKFDFGLLGPYITELNERGELQKWSVAVISTNTVDPRKEVALGVHDLKVYAVERRQSRALSINAPELGTVIKGITTIRDEFIDLSDLYETASLNAFIEHFGSEAAIRNHRPAERGLLLIYPLFTHHQLSSAERQKLAGGLKSFPILSDIRELFGLTLVFPPTQVPSFQFTYVQNATLPARV